MKEIKHERWLPSISTARASLAWTNARFRTGNSRFSSPNRVSNFCSRWIAASVFSSSGSESRSSAILLSSRSHASPMIPTLSMVKPSRTCNAGGAIWRTIDSGMSGGWMQLSNLDIKFFLEPATMNSAADFLIDANVRSGAPSPVNPSPIPCGLLVSWSSSRVDRQTQQKRKSAEARMVLMVQLTPWCCNLCNQNFGDVQQEWFNQLTTSILKMILWLAIMPNQWVRSKQWSHMWRECCTNILQSSPIPCIFTCACHSRKRKTNENLTAERRQREWVPILPLSYSNSISLNDSQTSRSLGKMWMPCWWRNVLKCRTNLYDSPLVAWKSRQPSADHSPLGGAKNKSWRDWWRWWSCERTSASGSVELVAAATDVMNSRVLRVRSCNVRSSYCCCLFLAVVVVQHDTQYHCRWMK